MSIRPLDESTNEFAVDKLIIETPEQTPLEFAVAGIGSRFLAILFDTLVQLIIGFLGLLLFALTLATLSRTSDRFQMWVGGFAILFYFLLYFGYYALFEIIWNGQTPGKRKVGIRVIKDDGRPLTAAETIGRNLMRIIDWLPLVYGVGIVSAFFSKGNKRLGDLLVGSLVVREASLAELKPTWQTGTSQAASVAPTGALLGADKLTPEEVRMIEAFMGRRQALEYSLRGQIADEIFAKVREKIQLPEGSGRSAESILEALSLERRNIGGFSR